MKKHIKEGKTLTLTSKCSQGGLAQAEACDTCDNNENSNLPHAYQNNDE